MKRIRNILMTIFCLQLLTAGVLYILGDWMNVDLAFVSNVDSQTLFIVSTLMILTTLASIPAGMRLFKFTKVASEIKMEGKPALLKWSIIRMVLIGDLLVINTMLYYFFGFEPAFGYLAIVCLLTMPFILPTMSRCKSELEA